MISLIVLNPVLHVFHMYSKVKFGKECYFLTILVAVLISCAPRGEKSSNSADIDVVLDYPAVNKVFDGDRIVEVLRNVEDGQYPNTHAVLINHKGETLIEQYHGGKDERWGDSIPWRDLNADSLHDLRSVSKSVTSILLGIALADSVEYHIDRPISHYFPSYDLGESSDSVLLRHVLTMTAGLCWNEMTVPYTNPENDEISMGNVPDPVDYVLSKGLCHDPGSHWYYNGGLTQVLGSVIYELTGQSLDAYADEKLFGPLGIDEYEWLGPSTWNPANPSAMSGLRLKARDLVKLGELYLNGGRWEDEQIVPEQWVLLSMKRHIEEIGPWSNDGQWGYGFQWWVGERPSGARVIAGVGNGNQRLYILPEDEMVVVIFAGEYNIFEGHSERLLDDILATRR